MKIMVLLEISASGEKMPRKFSRSVFSDEFASQKAYIVIDDLNGKIYLWLGRDLSRVHRRVAQRSAGFARGHGHEVEGYVVGRSFDIVEINEGEAELPSELLGLFDHKLEIYETHSVITAVPEATIGAVKPLSVAEETQGNFEHLVTKIEDEAAETAIAQESESEEVKVMKLEIGASPAEETRAGAQNEIKEELKNYVMLPKLSEMPSAQRHIYVEGLIQEALLTLEEEGMVSRGSTENSFILFSKEGDLLGTVLLESGADDELVYRATWIRDKDEKQFSRLLSSLST